VSQSKEFDSFRTSVTRRRLVVRIRQKEYRFQLYDHGPRNVRCPLLFLPPVSGTAEVR
jgi:maspardin